jgi:hypothetical protein
LLLTLISNWCMTGAVFGIVVAWDPSPDKNVAGYTVKYGTNSGDYQVRLDVGAQTNATIQLPTNGVTYYFVVTAYTAAGSESLPSNEVTYTAPGALQVAGPTGFQPQVSFVVGAGQVVQIQFSDDRANWTTLDQVQVATNQTISIVDPTPMTLPMRFYRLVCQGVTISEVTYLGPDALRCARIPSQNLATLSFPAQAGETVSVQTSEDLGIWTTLYELHPVSNQVVQVVDPGSARLARRFYRLMGGQVAARSLQMNRTSGSAAAKISFVAPPGDVVQIQASDDLQNWSTLNQLRIATNQWIEFVDPAAGGMAKRFYRLAPGN